MPETARFLKNLHRVLTDEGCKHGSLDGLEELYNLLTDPESGCMEALNPTHPGLILEEGMGCLMCADPDKNHHMEGCVRAFSSAISPRGERVAPIKLFGGALLLENGTDTTDVPLSPDAHADAMAQILIGQTIGRITSYGLMYHFSCGFACRARKTRGQVLGAYPRAKRTIRNTWAQAGIPQLKEIIGLYHFCFPSGRMEIARAGKGKIEQWLAINSTKYAELLQLI